MDFRPSRGYLKVGRFEGILRFLFVRTLISAVFFAVQGVIFIKQIARLAVDNPDFYENYGFVGFVQPVTAWISFILSVAILVLCIVCFSQRVFSGISAKKQLSFFRPIYALNILLLLMVAVQLAWTSFFYFGVFILILSLFYFMEIITITPALLTLLGLSIYSIVRLREIRKHLQKTKPIVRVDLHSGEPSEA